MSRSMEEMRRMLGRVRAELEASSPGMLEAARRVPDGPAEPSPVLREETAPRAELQQSPGARLAPASDSAAGTRREKSGPRLEEPAAIRVPESWRAAAVCLCATAAMGGILLDNRWGAAIGIGASLWLLAGWRLGGRDEEFEDLRARVSFVERRMSQLKAGGIPAATVEEMRELKTMVAALYKALESPGESVQPRSGMDKGGPRDSAGVFGGED